MPPIKFRLNPTWFGRRCRLKNFKIAATAERTDFCNSESLCNCDASGQVLAQSDLRFGRRCRLKNGGHFGYWNRTISAILNLCVTVMPPVKFQLNRTYGLGGDGIRRWRPSWILGWNALNNSESPCCHNPSH